VPPWHYSGAGAYGSAQSPPPLPPGEPGQQPPPPPPGGPGLALQPPPQPETWTEEDEQEAIRTVQQHLESLAAAAGLTASCEANFQPLLFKLWDANLQVCNALHDDEDVEALPQHLLAAAPSAAAAAAQKEGASQESWQQPMYQVRRQGPAGG
jgi:hypothetical protein